MLDQTVCFHQVRPHPPTRTVAVRQLRGPTRLAAQRMEVGMDQGYAELDTLLAAGAIARTAEGAQA